jgi:hypothetical protein
MLSLDKETFFSQRQLPEKIFYYSYNGQNYEMPLDYVLSKIGGSNEEKCLFILNELKANNDFILNVYLQDLADEYMQDYIRYNLSNEIERSLIDKRESYRFTLSDKDGIHEYIAYQDEEGRYHADEVEEVGRFAGWARFSRFTDYLHALLKSHTFDCKRIEKQEEGNE